MDCGHLCFEDSEGEGREVVARFRGGLVFKAHGLLYHSRLKRNEEYDKKTQDRHLSFEDWEGEGRGGLARRGGRGHPEEPQPSELVRCKKNTVDKINP